MIRHLEQRLGRPLNPRFDVWRPGDQRVFVADIGKARRELGWVPRVAPSEGVDRLLDWVTANRDLFRRPLRLSDASQRGVLGC